MKLLRIIGLAVAVACGSEGAIDQSPGTTSEENRSWNGYHWARTATPFTLKRGGNVSSAWQSSFNGARSDWSQSNGAQHF